MLRGLLFLVSLLAGIAVAGGVPDDHRYAWPADQADQLCLDAGASDGGGCDDHDPHWAGPIGLPLPPSAVAAAGPQSVSAGAAADATGRVPPARAPPAHHLP